jgi:hypothetical protein
MEPTATMGLAGFDILWRGESDVGGCECGSRRQKIQLAGSKDGVWVYTQPAEESKKEILVSNGSGTIVVRPVLGMRRT